MISSREVEERTWSTTRKVGPHATSYQALELSDQTVFEMARHYYTQKEIAETFGVSEEVLRDKHGLAYRAGKEEAFMKPRILLDRLLGEYMGLDSLMAKDVDRFHLLKAIELHAKKYEGMGSQVQVTHAVKPSVGDIRFVPLERHSEAA